MISVPLHLNLVKQYLYKRGFSDISSYKEKYLKRRIAIRMRKHECNTFEDYYELLRRDDQEVNQLKKTLSVNVTEFFRDSDTWHTFRMILRDYLDKKKPDYSLRIWSAGCAVGPEPYSIAMTTHHVLGSRNLQYNVKVIATDFNEELLQIARRGIYEGEILDNVPPDYLVNYFDLFGKKAYRVKYNIRRMVDFGYLNLITSNYMWKNLDMIFCRNVLIYLDKDIQEVIMKKFHRCLVSDGFLILGRTEILHPSLREGKYFLSNSLKHRIYRKSGSTLFKPKIKLREMDKDKRFKCIKCGKIFSQVASLRVHEKRDCGKIFRCKACGKKYDSEIRLRAHTKYFHQRGYGHL